MTSRCHASRAFAFLTLMLPALAVGGCDRSGVGRTYPVSGKVTLDGRPLNVKTTVILFKPDASRGNQSPFSPAAGVDQEGNYTLATKGKNGAPAGWYRVIVTAYEGKVEHPRTSAEAGGAHARRPAVRSVVAARYGREETTDLTMEVVENPSAGAYDLRLTSP